ncbi:Elf1-domain-containing protein [Ceratobasidium sp. AG-I]|nr:Elf1-domain-containing protein [Ceratobasidium sp. AG-I]
MGKRKSSKKPASRIKPTLDITFNCLFCHHEKSVTCKIDKREGLGYLTCKICAQTFQTKIHHLSEPIDVYSSWIDACDEAQASTRPTAARRLAAIDSDED